MDLGSPESIPEKPGPFGKRLVQIKNGPFAEISTLVFPACRTSRNQPNQTEHHTPKSASVSSFMAKQFPESTHVFPFLIWTDPSLFISAICQAKVGMPAIKA